MYSMMQGDQNATFILLSIYLFRSYLLIFYIIEIVILLAVYFWETFELIYLGGKSTIRLLCPLKEEAYIQCL